jgi:endo-1,4-beta-xylanase
MNRITILLFCIYLVNTWAQNPIGLRASASLRNILFGTAIRVNNLRQDADFDQYNANIRNNYQLIVPEFELKAEHVWFGENVYNFTDPDWLIGATPNSTGWVQQNKMQLRGHNLVWGSDKRIPNWLLNIESSITSDKAKSLMSDYIHTLVGRYRGKIPWWDVVNEAIANLDNDTHPFNLRDCFWFRKLGPDYIKYAFIFAHEADPDVQLYYNDYNIEAT